MTDFLLSELLQRTYRKLGVLNVSKVDSTSSTTTIVDSKQASKWKNNQWKDGTAIIVRTTDAAAPEGEFNRISLYDNATYKFTVDTAFTAAPESGDTYAFCDSTYPLHIMIELANDALQNLGLLDLVDTSTITIASEKTEYAGAAAWKRSKPIRIEVARDTDTNDYRWLDINDWDYVPAAAGSTPLIIFKQQYTTAYPTVKVWYRDLHPEITTYSAKIREEIHPALATAALTVEALTWYDRANSGQDEALRQTLNAAVNELERAKVAHPIPKWKKAQVKTMDLVF